MRERHGFPKIRLLDLDEVSNFDFVSQDGAWPQICERTDLDLVAQLRFGKPAHVDQALFSYFRVVDDRVRSNPALPANMRVTA